MHPRELSDSHVRLLEELVGAGFEIVSFPLFSAQIGVRKGNCAALLEPRTGQGFEIVGGPTFLVAGQLSARVERADGVYFVWKSERVAATPKRLAELRQFEIKLQSLLAWHQTV